MDKKLILEKRRHILGNPLMNVLSDTIMNMMDEWANIREQCWKERCLAAEDYISKSPCDPDITKEQITAYQTWLKMSSQNAENQFINNHKIL